MTREVTDQLYIELGYFTPEEYYVYTAEAEATASASATVSVTAGVIKNAASAQSSEFTTTVLAGAIRNSGSTMSSEFTQTATISHIEGADLFAFSEAEIALIISRLRDIESSLSSVYNISTDFIRIKQFASDASAEADISADPTVVIVGEAALTAAFSTSSQADRIRSNSASIAASADVSVTGTANLTGQSGISSESSLSATVLALSLAECSMTAESSITVSGDVFIEEGTTYYWVDTTNNNTGSYNTTYRQQPTDSGAAYNVTSGTSTTRQKSVLPSTTFESGLGDYTIEFWLTMTNFTKSVDGDYQFGSVGSVTYNIRRTTYLTFPSDYRLTIKNTANASWHCSIYLGNTTTATLENKHVVVERRSGNLYVWVDGQSQSTSDPFSSQLSNSIESPTFYNTNLNQSTLIILDEFRISKNARYTSNFTPPSTKFLLDSNTHVLFHFNNTNTNQLPVTNAAASVSAQASLNALGGLIELGDALLESTASTSIIGDKFLSAAASLDSISTVSADVLKLVITSAALTSESSLTAIGTRQVGSSSAELNLVSTQTTNVNYVSGALAQLQVQGFVVTATGRIRSDVADLDSSFTINIQSTRVRSTDVDLVAESSVTAEALNLNITSAALSSTSTLAAQLKGLIQTGRCSMSSSSAVICNANENPNPNLKEVFFTSLSISFQWRFTQIGSVGDSKSIMFALANSAPEIDPRYLNIVTNDNLAYFYITITQENPFAGRFEVYMTAPNGVSNTNAEYADVFWINDEYDGLPFNANDYNPEEWNTFSGTITRFGLNTWSQNFSINGVNIPVTRSQNNNTGKDFVISEPWSSDYPLLPVNSVKSATFPAGMEIENVSVSNNAYQLPTEIASADLRATPTLTADVLLVQFGNALLTTTANLSANLGRIQSTTANLSTTATSSAQISVIKSAESSPQSVSNLTSSIAVIRNATANPAAVASITILPDYLRNTQAALNTAASMTILGDKIRPGTVDMPMIAAQTTEAVKTVDPDLAFTSISITVTAAVFVGEFAVYSNVTSDLSADVAKIVDRPISLISQTVTDITATVIRSASGDLNAETTVTSIAERVITGESSIIVDTDMSVLNSRTRDLDSNLQVQTTSSITDLRIRDILADLDTLTEVSTSAQRSRTVTADLESVVYDFTASPQFIVGFVAEFIAFNSQLTVGRIIHIDPLRIYVIPQETRLLKIHPESRLYIIPEETRLLTIKGNIS